MSQASGTDAAEDQLTHNAEQPPPQIDAVGPIEEEKLNIEPLAELPPGISNVGPSQPSGPHIQGSAPNVPPVGDSAPEGGKVVSEKDQPTLSELANVMKQVLDIPQDSTIALKIGKDKRSRFWGVYKRVAEEHDGESLERYTTDMDIVLIFSGLLSAVSTGFIVAMESNLNSDPSDTTNVLLKQLVQIGLGNLAKVGTAPADPASTWSPSASAVRIQLVAYASLLMSLLAAFGAVLGKQWLGYYKSNRYGRGSEEERGKRRQEKFDGIVTWYFDAVVQSFPVILQISLLLFGIALGADMWYDQLSIAWVIIATTVFGFLFDSLTVMPCLISPACPFQTPTLTMLRMLRINRVLRLMFKRASSYSQQLTKSLHGVLKRLLGIVTAVFRGPVHAIGAFAE
ncbi:uncharacterized protein F5891DRAFT_1175915 [Suillus fuscotomentosus]|uniref:DUF6535 domain-containing protein n=1 Tax=Suillus fuscotomentosus TaxID=1912939 RepID=A0AAD4HFY3_9AGAM|nr:uncharacterized protein F5891DRAFT_1175915 [Suillus fuscotomentosus]KAG1894746.1 hypothetical protein F5891DRAFT_1175915 [Suillus fuscotomentosus]